MTATDRELVAAIRSELVAIDPARGCDRAAELAGLVTAGRSDAALARLVVRLRRGLSSDVDASTDRERWDDGTWDAAADHCRTAWLRGRYIGSGSLSVANGRTHLEFVGSVEESEVLVRRLAGIGLPAHHRVRRGRGVATWKSAETVGRFLSLVGASAALLELEARSVSRSLRGDLSRIVNAEAANLGRSVEAAGRQLAAIDAVEASGALSHEPPLVRAVARARRESPDASLTDLSARMRLHRSSVQRALERLELLALEPTGSAGRRVGPADDRALSS
jgi:DNA-binding transcriptional regulator WhiA